MEGSSRKRRHSSPSKLSERQKRARPTPEEDTGEDGRLSLTKLPPELLEHILSFLSYTQIAKLRLVCRQFCETGNNLLKKGFQQMQTLVNQRVTELKTQMPRRESIRHKHPLARECDIYQSISVKLSLLRLHFGKYMTAGACSFYPGQVLDEVKQIMLYVKSAQELDYAYVVTTELSDLCHMAIEYHNEHLPKMPKTTSTSSLCSLQILPSTSTAAPFDEIRKSQQRIKNQVNRILGIPLSPPSKALSSGSQHKKCKQKIWYLNKKLTLCQKMLDHHKQKLVRYERHFQDLARKVEGLTKEVTELRQTKATS